MKLFVGIALFLISIVTVRSLVARPNENIKITLPDEIVSKIRSAADLNSVFKLLGIELSTKDYSRLRDDNDDDDDDNESDDDDDTSSSHEVNNLNYLSNPKEAGCDPIETKVDLNIAVESDSIVYPRCVKVKRCGGCCQDDNLECRPVSFNKVIVKVIEIQKEPSPVRTKREIRTSVKSTNVTIEEHTSCGCFCPIKEEDCNIDLRNYERSLCSCSCKNKEDEISCKAFDTHVWDESRCRCICKKKESCSYGQEFMEDSCRCEATTMKDISGANCGKRLVFVSEKSIAGAMETESKRWPWMAALMRGRNGHAFCGGTLISDRYVLTSAHCVERLKPQDLIVRLGAVNYLDPEDGDVSDFQVESIRIHEKFSAQDNRDDIALIKLGSPANFSQFVWPACLPPTNRTFENELGYVTGWGTEGLGGPINPVLLKVDVNVLKQEECLNGYYDQRSINISKSTMCITSTTQNEDYCFVQSGGPLSLKIFPGERWHVAGIGSKRGFECSNVEHPNIYTRVNHYLEWISINTRPVPDVPTSESSTERRPFDCSEVCSGRKECMSGVYSIYPLYGQTILVFCDMETDGGGWTVLIRRMKQTPQEDFRDGWNAYKNGFGKAEGEYWIGNEVMHQMTSKKNYTLRIEATAEFQEDAWGEFAKFKVASEDLNYRLMLEEPTVGNLVYNASGGLIRHNGLQFSTYDNDNDNSGGNCASLYGSGNWYDKCYNFHPTGIYGFHNNTGIKFEKWTQDYPETAFPDSLQMKIRHQKPTPDVPQMESSTELSAGSAPGGKKPFDCSEVCSDHEECNSGVYSIYPIPGKDVKVFCDMETAGGGWTLLIRRMEQTPQVDFKVSWEAYKNGFGNADGEYWIGNEVMHQMTLKKNYTLRIEATAEDQEDACGEFAKFKIDSEDLKYRLTFDEQTIGNIAYNISGGLRRHNGLNFSTSDRDNDLSPWGSCGALYGSGMWYSRCYNFHPTGIYGVRKPAGIKFEKWTHDYPESAFATSLQMKIRPQNANYAITTCEPKRK